MRINVGCGATPTPGWTNFDNSLGVRLARIVPAALFPVNSRPVVIAARASGIKWASATKIPLASGSVSAVYSCHMLEHLDRQDGAAFLREAHRVLADGGIVRIVVPDLKHLVDQYSRSGDADGFMESTLLSYGRPRALRDKIRAVAVGFREHRWMYDGGSLSKALVAVGFKSAGTVKPGETTISDPGSLDLYERAEGSLFVEAVK